MSPIAQSSDGERDSPPDAQPDEFDTAEDFARERLSDAERPVTPAGLAEIYDCTAGHMRRVLRQLMHEGEAVRVSRGQYLGPDAVDGEIDVELEELVGDVASKSDVEVLPRLPSLVVIIPDGDGDVR